jgi:DNA-binding NarL/FixJ family response regulator
VSEFGSILDWAALAYAAIPLAFLAGLLRTRLRRGALTQLVVELSARPDRERVRAALARALGDPTLELVPADQARPHSDRAATTLDGLAMVYDASLLDDPELVAAAAATARLVLERGATPQPPPLDELTAREREVLTLLAAGKTDRGIAQELYVTPKTVEAHVRSIFRKLNLPADPTENKRVQAALRYLATPR